LPALTLWLSEVRSQCAARCAMHILSSGIRFTQPGAFNDPFEFVARNLRAD
jgi:hypothetical protein